MQISDILTKDLAKEKHRQHRRVLFGIDPIKVISVALPESQKLYIRRHNEELAQRLKTENLKSQFAVKSSSVSQSALVAAVQSLLAVVSSH